MKTHVLLALGASAVLLCPHVSLASGWALDGVPYYHPDLTAPGGGANPVGTPSVSPTSFSLSATANPGPQTSGCVIVQNSTYGYYTQNFVWLGMGPTTQTFLVNGSFDVSGSADPLPNAHADSYAAPGLGGVQGSANEHGGAVDLHSYNTTRSGGFFSVTVDPKLGGFKGSTQLNFGVLAYALAMAYSPPGYSTASASGSLSVP